MEFYSKNDRGHLRGHHFVRTCAVEFHMDTSQKHAKDRKSHFVEIYRENAGRESHDARFVRARGLRSRNAHGHVTRGILCENLQGKCRTLPRPPRLNTGP